MEFDGFDGFIAPDSWSGETDFQSYGLLWDNKSKTLRGRLRAGRKAFIKAKGLRKLLAVVRGFLDPDPLVGYFDLTDWNGVEEPDVVIDKYSIQVILRDE